MYNYLQADISASAIRANLQAIRARLREGVKICAVVKCDCYGHGQELLLPVIAPLADVLGVATPAEALHLRDQGVLMPILVFFSAFGETAEGTGLSSTLDELLRRNVTLTVTADREVDILCRAIERTDADARIHVKIDTGMTRSGVLPSDAPRLIHRLRNHPAIRLTGVFTHLATADEADKTAVRRQLRLFEDTCATCEIGPGIVRHAANSAAIIDLPEAQYDMVRPGIAMYGYPPGDELHESLPLRPAMRLTAHLMQIKTVPAGTKTGYGLTHAFTRDSRVGLVPVGYGDGYLRSLSNRAMMRVAGQDVPVRGRVSMDQTIVDLTDCPEANVGDVVEIISPNPDDPHSMEHLARLADTIPYEIMCRLGRRVRRTLVE